MRKRLPIHPLDALLPPISRTEPWTLTGGETPLDPAALFVDAYRMIPPEAVVRPPPPPRDRAWLPGPATRPVPGARIVSRHPEFRWCAQDVPVTKVGRSPRSGTHGFQNRIASLKSHRTIRAASINEYRAVVLAEIDPAVDTFVEQPVWLRYPTPEGPKRARPDLYVAGANEFWEIKYENQASLDEARFEMIGRAFAGLGYGYRVLTERFLRDSTTGLAATRIYADRHAPKPPDAILVALRRLLVRRGSMSVGEIVEAFPTLTAKAVHALIRRLFLRAATLDAPVDGDFRVVAGGPYAAWDGERAR